MFPAVAVAQHGAVVRPLSPSRLRSQHKEVQSGTNSSLDLDDFTSHWGDRQNRPSLSLRSSSSAVQSLVPGYDRLVKLDHQRGALVPVGGDLGGEAAVREDGLHDARREGGAVQAAVLLGHGDVGVDERLLLDDVVSLVVVVGLLQLVGFLPKQRLPDVNLKRRREYIYIEEHL